MCIVVGLLRVDTAVAANGVVLTGAANGPSSLSAGWQSATALDVISTCHMTCVTDFSCVATSTPTRNSTWGAVKALYR
jgi:hypothetical protein